MKFASLVLLTSLTATTAFAPPRALSTTTALHSTLQSPPQRTAPAAGHIPEWENRPGLSPEEFMASDLSKPDLGGMWECPLTRWNSEDIDVREAQRMAKQVPGCPLEIRASEKDNAMGARYFAENREMIRSKLLEHGAIWFRGFELMKSVKGNREMHEALGLDPCLDPLHSSGLRKFASERDALYEEVNKPSLRQHYIGLHNESTAKRTAAYAAFVCFQRATEGGGRFLVADGAAILAELDTKVLEKLYNRKIRISVSNLDIPPALPGVVKEGIRGLVDVAVAPKFDMDLEMIYESDGKPGRLQAVETAESPINRHPVTGMPVWFNNAHNHARKLRDRRPCGVPEVGMTEVFYADTMEPLDLEDCMEIKRASEKHITALSMEPGDVLLVDNYRALHGRDVFQGDRFHAVTWFTWDQNEEWRGNERRIVEKNAFNQAINKMMDWLPKDFESNQN
ncbi:hypothetical protein HJC23_009228 [Cyclotella cryptica]|uniref:TauD/TfdA-like domain-containing protein n=1 Tax=Cyclotella cryptica TaxID=29204 RepID=A0ABD3NIP0_9STRA|eukprot:CCRYP_021063-RC/>CCRYP_021063-RC protein AED:0.11 eAED:0.11 QI:185/1/1/1/1/1/4/91/452